MKLEAALGRLSQKGTGEARWQPEIFDLSQSASRQSMEALLEKGEVLFCHDEILAQLEELIETREPSRKYKPAELKREVQDFLDGRAPLTFGSWVYYPWSRRLVHLLPRKEYRELRSDRNRYKITREEQARLQGYTIGIAGLSVSKPIAILMGMEGVGGSYRFADFDSLSLSNMNRLQSGTHNLGVNKTLIAARELFEIDPYLDIKLFQEQLTEENIDAFLLEGGKIDILVEMCDDLFIKVRLRERARALGIPVLMYTNDRGLIDVERFDLEPERPLFHGLAGALEAESFRDLSTRDKVPFVLKILGEEQISNRSIVSLLEIEESVSSWPQLASGVALGGMLCTDAARRILLGEFNSSGRYYVDVEEIVSDGSRESEPVLSPMRGGIAEEALSPVEPLSLPRRGPSVEREEVVSMVRQGMLAPSGGNCQPWKFIFRQGRLLCIHDIERSKSFLDFEHSATYLAFGAALENMVLAAQAMGLATELRLFPQADNPLVICELLLIRTRGNTGSPELLEQIPYRLTNRKLAEPVPLNETDRKALLDCAAASGARLHLLEERDRLDIIGDLLGKGDRFRFLNQIMHREMMAEIRWNAEEVKATRDGLDVATLELTPADQAGMRLVSRWGPMKLLGKLGGGRTLEKPSRKAIQAASAVGLITVEGVGPQSYLMGGRAMERLWLTATSRGLAFQPVTAILYLFSRLERGDGTGLSEKEIRKLAKLRKDFRQLFDIPDHHAEVMLFRMAHAEPASARSLRRKVEDVLIFE